MTSRVSANIAEVVIKSDLLPIGVTVDAGMSSISVAVAMHAPTGDPTAHTPRPPESATARSPTSTPKLPANGAKSSNSDGQDANEEKLTEDMTEPDAGKENMAVNSTRRGKGSDVVVVRVGTYFALRCVFALS